MSIYLPLRLSVFSLTMSIYLSFFPALCLLSILSSVCTWKSNQSLNFQPIWLSIQRSIYLFYLSIYPFVYPSSLYPCISAYPSIHLSIYFLSILPSVCLWKWNQSFPSKSDLQIRNPICWRRRQRIFYRPNREQNNVKHVYDLFWTWRRKIKSNFLFSIMP